MLVCGGAYAGVEVVSGVVNGGVEVVSGVAW